MEKLHTPPPLPPPRQRLDSRGAAAAVEVLTNNLNLISIKLNSGLEGVKGEIVGLRKDMRMEREELLALLKEEQEERRRESLSAKLWVATLVSLATILGNVILKFFQ